MKHLLSELPYANDALAPVISEQTIEIHHGKHHQAYVNNLNKLIESTEFENSSLETIIKQSAGGIFNNAAQVWNHAFYFDQFNPNGKHEPSGKLVEAINAKFGSFEQFKIDFVAAGIALFGSGWTWLVKTADGSLDIVTESNAGNPMTNGLTPILTFDVWEHAYYLDYQNRRPDHLNALWNIIDWNVIESRF